jgi:hypothetical protein
MRYGGKAMVRLAFLISSFYDPDEPAILCCLDEFGFGLGGGG